MENLTLNVLIACEESQAFCKEFRKLGCNAFSCDLKKCSGGRPEWHIVGDATLFLSPEQFFVTQDGKKNFVDYWDLLIAHPPCTYLSKAGNVYMYDAPGVINKERYKKMLQARELFYKFYNASIRYIAIENPIPFHIADLPPRTCVINPFEFGDSYTKATYLWLKNLPTPFPTLFVPKKRCKSYVYSTRGSEKRSKTFTGIAVSCAKQWFDTILNDYGWKKSWIKSSY